MLYKKLVLFCSAVFVVSTIYAQAPKQAPTGSSQASQSSSNVNNQSKSGNNTSKRSSPSASSTPQTPQQVNAQGQDALNGTTARKDQMQQEKLKVQSEKYQAEIDQEKKSQQSNAAGSKALNNASSQSVSSINGQPQQNPQIQAADNTKNVMPQPTLMQAEANQDQAENLQNEQNKQHFYDPQANQ